MQLTKSLCRRIAAGVLIFSAVLHVVYFALVVSGAVEDTRSSPTNNAMVVTTIFFFIFSSLYIVAGALEGNIWLPLFVTIVNFFFTLMIIALLMNPPAPVAWLVVWLFTDFACFATSFWLCWVERSKFPCVKGSEQYSKQDEADVAAV
tara:strand:- start:4 stop:447 length:444 start_codon:yes stop_codon:yes gene_type:complete